MPLAMIDAQALSIRALNARGDGVALAPGAIAVPGALPGERVLAQIEGQRGRLIEIIEPSPQRATPICGSFGVCGGCAAQHMSASLYASWKRRLLVDALAKANVRAEVGALVDAHGEGRRRATFHARCDEKGGASVVGFMKARTHDIVAIESPAHSPLGTLIETSSRAMNDPNSLLM